MVREPTPKDPGPVRRRIIRELERLYGTRVTETPHEVWTSDGGSVETLEYEVDGAFGSDDSVDEEREIETDDGRWRVTVWKRSPER